MGEVLPWPTPGDVFADVRGEDRTLRVSCHADRDLVVVSLWAGGQCRGSFRLAAQDVPRLADLLKTMAATVAPAQPTEDEPRAA